MAAFSMKLRFFAIFCVNFVGVGDISQDLVCMHEPKHTDGATPSET
jgi:hypothetical protein